MNYRNMDCMEGMKEYPDKYFDLAIVDPPYGIGEDKNKTVYGKAGKANTFINKRDKFLSKIHTSQKPIKLYKWLLSKYAKQGDKILDTHVGSGSSIIACLDMGFDVTGFELDEDYYKASMKRIDDFQRQLKLAI